MNGKQTEGGEDIPWATLIATRQDVRGLDVAEVLGQVPHHVHERDHAAHKRGPFRETRGSVNR